MERSEETELLQGWGKGLKPVLLERNPIFDTAPNYITICSVLIQVHYPISEISQKKKKKKKKKKEKEKITKTHLFKYIENFTTKKVLIFFIFLLKT